MYVGVFLHVGLLVEALAAERARERPDVAVDQQVRAQRRRPLEPLLAHAATVRPRVAGAPWTAGRPWRAWGPRRALIRGPLGRPCRPAVGCCRQQSART